MTINKKTTGRMLGIAALVLGGFGVRAAVAKGPATITTMPFADAKWTNLMGDGGPSMAPLWGDPTKSGESGFLLKLPAGFVSPAHSHSHDYWAVTVSGKMSHWQDTQTEKDAVPLPVGSYVMMPAKLKHISKCAPGAECIVLVRMKDKFDFTAADAKGEAKNDKKDAKGTKDMKDMKDMPKEAKK
jgi:quercetin dioxygenase-like cupin family protein